MTESFPPLLYVAGAYTASTPTDILHNISKAEKVSIALIRNGWNVITPHKNTGGYEQYEDDVLSKQTWVTMDLNILERCDALYVMNNWRASRGTQTEICFVAAHDIPTFWEERIPANELRAEVMI